MKQKNIYIITLSLFLLLITLNLVSSEQEIKNKDISLEIIDNNITFYRDNVVGRGEVMKPDGYLFEGEHMNMNVKVYSHKGLEEVKEVYMTLDDKIEVNCQRKEVIDGETGIWGCVFTAETPESMFGFGLVKVVVKSTSEKKVSKEIGTYYFNPEIKLSMGAYQINLPQVNSGEDIYSDTIIVRNDVDKNSNVSLNIFVTAAGFTDKNFCYGGKIPINAVSYYAENGEYSTKNDPRADKEGYVKLIEADHYDRSLDTSILDHSLINEEKTMNFKFRVNVPENCEVNYIGEIYFWAVPRFSSRGYIVNMNFDVINDSTPPEAKIRFNSNIFEVNGFDDKSDVTTTKKITCLKKNGEVCIKELRRFIIKDETGNDLTLTAIYEKVGGQTKTTISSLKYHGENVDDYNYERVESNWFWLYTFPNFQETRIQNLKIGNEYITTYYNPTTNKTRITIKNKTDSKSYTEEGYSYVELYTDKGKLKYEMKKGVLPVISQDVYETLKNSERVDIIVVLDEKDSDKVDLLINSLSSSEFILKKKLYGDYAFAGNVNKEGLEKLKYNQDIKYIYFNRLIDIA